MKKVTIWGLKNIRHSHRFIHKGFYDNFMKLGYNTQWVDDSKANQNLNSDIFFVSGVAAKFMKFDKRFAYIFHNVELNDSQKEFLDSNRVNHINLQVYTNDSTGSALENRNILYDAKINTLFQPWGTPLSKHEWKDYVPRQFVKTEWWIGSIWNNSQNQGNRKIMNEYKQALKIFKVKLKRRGGSRFNINGLSELQNSNLVRKSRFGATIVGDWQKQVSYIPCRFFKNVSFGIAPLSNMQSPLFTSDKQGFIDDLGDLLNFSTNESEKARFARFHSTRNDIVPFTYTENITRVIKILNNR